MIIKKSFLKTISALNEWEPIGTALKWEEKKRFPLLESLTV